MSATELVPVPERRNWSRQNWLLLNTSDLQTERLQAAEEGRDLSGVQAEFDAVIGLDLAVETHQQRAERLLDRIQGLPMAPGFPFVEPSAFEDIRSEAAPGKASASTKLADDVLLDKALGGWTGRCCGCALGKPVEGRQRWQIEKYLKAQNRWPLTRYFSLNAAPELAKECRIYTANSSIFEEGMTCAPADDDTNYTTIGLAVLKKHGAAFTPAHVAAFWLFNLPVFHVCTAERVAYRNLLVSIPPPQSASYRNVYREWIGAQIRADFFGYVNPGNPARAAEFAWRDASISHVKNGLYGEMWVAAMLAAAYILRDVGDIIRAGLEQIPRKSRLHAAIARTLELKRKGLSYDEVIEDHRSRWNEENKHHWCHTLSNAELVAIALLWGDNDFEKVICRAVMPGFDTDCNGATAGSIMGVMLGAKALPSKWTAPLHDTLLTEVMGYHRVSLTQLAGETLQLIHSVEAGSNAPAAGRA